MARSRPAPSPSRPESANEQWKRRWDDRLWGSLMAAVLIHGLVILAWPDMSAADWASPPVEALTTLEVPEVEIPPEPEAIRRPATPVVSETPVADDVTMTTIDFDEVPDLPLPPPAADDGAAAEGQPGFTPYTVAPAITNRAEVARTLEREYPSVLRDAGIGGTVMVLFHIDETGRVVETRLAESSGHAGLDEAAETVADVMRFTPAINRDREVAVWVSFPIVFQVR